MLEKKNPKILILANHYITLYSFRKELIEELKTKGCDLYLCYPKIEGDEFQKIGCKIINCNIDRRGINPIKDLALICRYYVIIKRIKPDIILSFTIKPNIYGTLVSNFLEINQICNITGTGGIFIKENLLAKVCRILYKITVKRSYKVFFQNKDDLGYFKKYSMIGENYDLLPGSGCNIKENAYVENANKEGTIFLFIGRIMKIKGIEEFLDCAKEIKTKYKDVEFLIAGWGEEKKYLEQINELSSKGIVRYLGYQKEIKKWIRLCDCVVLPSHGGEGVPNALLEGAAIGRLCIATDVPGSREVVKDNVNGFIFKPESKKSMKEAMLKVIGLPREQRIKFGRRGRERIEKYFDRSIVVRNYIREIDNIS